MKKKIWHGRVTYRSVHRFSFPQGRRGWKLAKGWGGIPHVQEWEQCLFYPLACFPGVSYSPSYSQVLNNNAIQTLASHNGIVGFFCDKHYE